MSKGIQGKEPDARKVYADIIDMPHWQSPTKPHMSLYDRSAQFASYKALSGYEDMVAEEARLTDSRLTLEEHELNVLNQKLTLVSDVLADGHNPELTFTVFKPDEHKEGGNYVDIIDKVKRIDTANRRVILMSTKEGYIEFDSITAIHGELVDYIDESIE